MSDRVTFYAASALAVLMLAIGMWKHHILFLSFIWAVIALASWTNIERENRINNQK